MGKAQKVSLGKQQTLKVGTQKKEPKTAYLTKRVLERAISKGSHNLTSKAMDLKGYVITVNKGYLVRKSKDGTFTKLSKIAVVKTPSKITLD